MQFSNWRKDSTQTFSNFYQVKIKVVKVKAIKTWFVSPFMVVSMLHKKVIKNKIKRSVKVKS